jgi:hypothetical protein
MAMIRACDRCSSRIDTTATYYKWSAIVLISSLEDAYDKATKGDIELCVDCHTKVMNFLARCS